MHWSVRWLLLSFAFSCLMRVSSAQSADQPFSCSNQQEQQLVFGCSQTKWTAQAVSLPQSRQLNPNNPAIPQIPSTDGQSKEARCCMNIHSACSLAQYVKEKCETKSGFGKSMSDGFENVRKECTRLGVTYSPEMCAKEEANLQPLSQNCKPYEKWLKCPDPAKVMSGGIALTTNWINWLIVMMTVIVVKYFI